MTKVMGEIVMQDDTIKPLRILFDTDTTSSIIFKPFKQTISRYKSVKTCWKTMGGIFEMQRKAHVQFKLPEFSHNKTIIWNIHVDEHTPRADA